MKIHREYKNGIWIVRLEYKQTIYEGRGSELSVAMSQAFGLIEGII
jgi:hypothetical protein